MEWICTEARLPNPEHDGEGFLVYVSGKPQENITLIGVMMTAGYSPEDGWVIDEYPLWENPPVTHWMPLPAPPEEDKASGEPVKPALNGKCKTGKSPTGHCGAAACCSEPYDCCAQCPNDCNCRCGWLPERKVRP